MIAQQRARIGHSVENQLEQILWNLILGQVELHELAPALSGWWSLAHEEGRRSRQPEVDRLTAENESLWIRANNDSKTAAELVQRRLDGSFEEAARQFFCTETPGPAATEDKDG